MHNFNAVVVGLGNIGQGYDYDCNDDSLALTHCAAYSQHKNITLVAGIDPNLNARIKFQSKYKCSAFESLEDLNVSENIDLFSICAPTELQLSIFKKVVKFHPKAILCEKPFGTNLQESKEMIEIAESHQIRLFVNYFRCCEPGHLELKKIINSGELGTIERVFVWYTKGIRLNASHFINLLQFYFGDIEIFKWHETLAALKDPEGDFGFKVANTQVNFFSAKSDNFPFLEMEVIGSKGIARTQSSGEIIQIRKLATHSFFSGKAWPILASTVPNSKFSHYQFFVVNEIYNSLINNTKSAIDATHAFKTTAAIDLINDLQKAAEK